MASIAAICRRRFLGEHRKSRLELNVELFYEGKIDNAQLGKHCYE